MSFKIVRNDIVKMNTDAIVNTANDHATVGSGCDHAVYTAAGYNELLVYRKEHIGFVEEGGAFITPGFNLQAKYIIHAVSPLYEGGEKGEEEKLRSCYRKSLALAKENNIKSIAFPLISTGGFGYPKEEGMRIALDEIYDFLFNNEMVIYLVVFDTKATLLGEKLYPDLQAYIDHNYVLEKRDEEYNDRFFGSVRTDERRFAEYTRERDELEERLARKSAYRSNQEEPTIGAAPMPSMSSAMAPSRKKSSKPDKAFSIFKKEKSADLALDECYESKACLYDEEEALEELKRKLDEKKAHLADSFSEYLLYLIQSRGMTNVEVYKKAIVDKKLFAKVKNDSSYHPQKLTCLQLCMGAELNLDETRDLLARAGYALSPCDMRDVIFSYFIENEIYDMVDLDIQLEEYGIPCIIA